MSAAHPLRALVTAGELQGLAAGDTSEEPGSRTSFQARADVLVEFAPMAEDELPAGEVEVGALLDRGELQTLAASGHWPADIDRRAAALLDEHALR